MEIIKQYSILNIRFAGIKLVCPECGWLCESIISEDQMQVTKYKCSNNSCKCKYEFVPDITVNRFQTLSQVQYN